MCVSVCVCVGECVWCTITYHVGLVKACTLHEPNLSILPTFLDLFLLLCKFGSEMKNCVCVCVCVVNGKMGVSVFV